MVPRPAVAFALALALVGATAGPLVGDTLTGRGGAVATAEAAATEVGLDILRADGNAVDAAVAAALALAVVHPQAGNLGGGGFAVIRIDGEVHSLDFRETAPAAAFTEMYLDADGEPVPGASWVGPLATGVPGSPHGLWELHRRFGSLTWPAVVGPAIELAGGFVVSERLSRSLERKRAVLSSFAETATVLLPGGEVPRAGSTLALPDLQRTLDRYARLGPQAITSGPAAQAIADAVAAHGGRLTAEDLAAYRSVWRRPLRFEAFGWSFASMDLPSSGGFLAAQSLQLLERNGWREFAPGSADRVHLATETWRRGFADRFLLGDPSTTEATVSQLLAPEWLAERAADIDPARATDSAATRHWPGGAPAAESDETTHLSVVDSKGNTVALTTTLNGGFGCGLLVPGVGFLLNNEMDDFTVAPGRPNAYDIIQGEANLVRPGKRMLSSMTPTVAWRDDEMVALGGSGGSKIPTAVTQILLDVLLDDLALQPAVDRARFHHQWLPDRLLVEPGAISPEVRAGLESRGHRVESAKPGSIAEVQAVRRRGDGIVESAADSRGPGVPGVLEPTDSPPRATTAPEE